MPSRLRVIKHLKKRGQKRQTYSRVREKQRRKRGVMWVTGG